MDKFYRFQVGNFDCIAVSDGEMNYPLPGLFRDMPLEQIQQELAARGLPLTHFHSPYTLLFIDTGSSKVLVDTGIGKYAAGTKVAFAEVDNTRTRPGIAVESLAQAGVSAEEIETIIITHAHPDHVGGNFDAEGRPSFPHARYAIWQEEWDFWFSNKQTAAAGTPPHFVEMARADLGPLEGEITLLDGDEEILPGITAVRTPGHTPGHMAVLVESAGEQLMHISDAVLLPIHLELPGVVAHYDILPEVNLATRQWLCDQLAEEETLIFAHHFAPFPNLGTIENAGAGWRWRPQAVAS